MMSSENPVHFQHPVLEDTITPTEIHALFSLFQPDSTTHSTSSSENNRTVYSMEERKRKRMISNRESARRSRWRKKKHMEDLTNEADRLKLENREMKNLLCTLTRDSDLVQRDSNRLLFESIYLHHKLTGLHQILAPTMQLQ